MKKKMGFICLMLLLVTIFSYPRKVFAENFSVTLSGGESANSGDKIDFTLAIKSEADATGFEATIKYDESILEFINISKEETWTGNNGVNSVGNNLLKFTNQGVTGESSVATLKFRVKSSNKMVTTISVEDIKLTVSSESSTDASHIVLTHDSLVKDIAIKSDDNTLKNIKIDNKTINGFTPTVYNYTVEVASLTENVMISAVLNDSEKASFVDGFGSREISLDYGENIVEIKSQSESGKVTTYKVKIIRKDDRVVNNDLKNIIINGGKIKIAFNSSVLSYTIKTYKLETIDIEAEASDSQATVVVDAPKNVIIGENKIKITVTAVTGDKKEYALLIVNSDVPTDTHLKNLSVKGININFDSDKYDYVIRYDKSYKSGLTIYKTTVSPDVEVNVIGNTNLKEGSKIKVVVEALDGSGSSEYTILLEKDKRVNFFLVLEVIIGIILIILIVIQLNKRKKKQGVIEKKQREEELEKTKEIKL